MTSPSPTDQPPAPAEAQRWALRWTAFDLPAPSPVDAPAPERQRSPSGLRVIDGGASPPSPINPEPPPETATMMIGGRYEVLAELGRGAVGEVFEVRHRISGRRGVLKVLSARAARRPDQVRRFEREFRLLHHLDHPGVLRVLDYDVTAEGRPFIVMEHLCGRDLKSVLEAEGRLSVERAVAIAGQLCEAIIFLHGAGIIHRDIKPGNILVLDRGHAREQEQEQAREQIKIFDLGVSKCTRAYYAVDRPYMTPPELRSVTNPGTILATAGYDAPELAVRGSSFQQDVYALGVVVFKMLTGQMPPGGLRAAESYDERFDAIGLPGPRELADAVRLAMHPDPDRRYRDVAALREEIMMVREILGAELQKVDEGRPPMTASVDPKASPAARERPSAGGSPRGLRWLWGALILGQAIWIAALYSGWSPTMPAEQSAAITAEDAPVDADDTRRGLAGPDASGDDVDSDHNANADDDDDADDADADAEVKTAIPDGESSPATVDPSPSRSPARRRSPATTLPVLDELRRCLSALPKSSRISIAVEIVHGAVQSAVITGAPMITEQCLRGRLRRLRFPEGPRRRSFDLMGEVDE